MLFLGSPSGEDYRLATTLLDAHRYSARQMAALYQEHWEAGTVFAELKTHQRGARTVLSSKTPGGVLQQIWAHLLVHHALRETLAWRAGPLFANILTGVEPARFFIVLGSCPFEQDQQPKRPLCGARMPFEQDGPRILAAIETAWEVLQQRHAELPDVYVAVDRTGARHNLAQPSKLEADMRPELPIHQDAITAGPRATLEAILHVATHALCQVRGISETSNRGMRHNKHFRAIAEELGMKWPEGEPPHATKGFSPVPLTDQAVWGYGPLLTALGRALDGVVLGLEEETTTKGRSGARITLQCECTNPPRTFQIGPRIAGLGGIRCDVCGARFREK